MDDQARYEYAAEQVQRLKALYWHFAIFLLINGLLLAINLTTSHHRLWFVWPLMCWGIGLALHAFAVLVVGGLWGANWEEQKIRQIMGDLQNHE
jgi:hypothetical protein